MKKNLFTIVPALVVIGLLFLPISVPKLQGGQGGGTLALFPGSLLKINEAQATGTPATATGGGPSSPNLLNCALDATSCAIYLVTYVISGIGSLYIALGAWVVEIALRFSKDLINAPAVKIGFSVSLAVANLGFVLGIIVIAIATILRAQTYGLKQILWKLVAMAILVNFGLIIAGAILNFSDQLTGYFINQASPSVGDNWWQFTTTLTSAFQPNALTEAPSASSAAKVGAVIGGVVAGVPGALAGAIVGTAITNADVWQSAIYNMVFVTIFDFLIAFTLLAIGIMLAIRFVYVGVLLVLLPFAWLTWVFPGLQGNWTKWWRHFLKWALFAPLTIFFLYLAIYTAGNQQSYLASHIQNANLGSSSGGLIAAYVTKSVKVTEAAGQEIIILALAVGGLFAANALSIAGAGTAMKLAQSAGTATAGYVGKKSLQYVSAPFRRGERPLALRAREWAASRKTGVGRFAAGLVARPITRLAAAGGEDIFEGHKKSVRDMTVPDLQAAFLTSFGPRKAAIASVLGEKNALDGLPMAVTHSKGMRDTFKRNGKAKEYLENVEQKTGVSSEMYEAKKRGASEAEVRQLARDFAKTFSRQALAGMQATDLYSGQAKFGLNAADLKELSEYFAHGLALEIPAYVSGLVPHLKGASLANFQRIYPDEIERAEGAGLLTTEKAVDLLDKFKNLLANLATSGAGAAPAATAAPATPAAPAAPSPGGGAPTGGTTP